MNWHLELDVGAIMKRALVVGIDHYEQNPLATCASDASAIAQLLERNDDGSNNFDVRLLTDAQDDLSRSRLLHEVKTLFERRADTALLYFAGHGALDEVTTTGYLVTPDREEDSTGVALSEVMSIATQAQERISSTVIILDCCRSGNAGELRGSNTSILGNGMTILTSCDRAGNAASDGSNGVFSGIVIDALAGAAADIRGHISPASVYSHVDQSLSAWDQRPVYKANVHEFISLRRVRPRISDDILNRLPDWFSTPEAEFALDPSFEPEAPHELITDVESSDRAQRIATFQALQRCNRNGLVRPVGTEHMYHAAILSKSCELTPLGRHFRMLAEKKRLRS